MLSHCGFQLSRFRMTDPALDEQDRYSRLDRSFCVQTPQFVARFPPVGQTAPCVG